MKNNLAYAVRDDAESLRIVKRVVGACEDVKGKDISVLDVRSLSDVADFFVIASARSDRQVQGLTNRVVEELYHSGTRPLAVEGYEEGQWVIIDTGDVVVHLFYEPVREHYDLESLWMRAQKLELRS
jgi:ribosome-associated protein